MGVIDLIKSFAVSLPLTDLNKRKALKDKTGFDVDKVLVHLEEERLAEQAPVEKKVERRVKSEEVPAGRRTTPKYNVVKKTEEPSVETTVE